MSIGITQRTLSEHVMICFKEWIRFLHKRKGTKDGKQLSNQRSGESRSNDHEGQTPRSNQTEFTADVHVFSIPE